jgi:hypothetical protein
VVHAAGPAGEAACCKAPVAAFELHYTLTERLADWAAATGGTLILLGTVAPNVGFYGPLKRAAVCLARIRAGTAVGVVECGQIIGPGLPLYGPGLGVVGLCIQRAVRGGVLEVPVGAHTTLRCTPLSAVVEAVAHLRTPGPHPATVSPVSEPGTLGEIVRVVQREALLRYGQQAILREPAGPHGLVSYTDPTGEPYPVPPLATMIGEWVQSREAQALVQSAVGKAHVP